MIRSLLVLCLVGCLPRALLAQAIQVRVVQMGRAEVGQKVDLVPRIVVTMPGNAAIPSVTLRLADPDQPFLLRNASVPAGSSASIAFDSLRVLPVGYIAGSVTQLVLRIDVDGQEIPDTRLEIAVRPPNRDRLTLRAQIPDSIAIGVSFDAAIVASATMDNVTLPVRGTPVTLTLPDGRGAPEQRTGPDGRALFNGLVLSGGQPGNGQFTFSFPAFGRSTERSVGVMAGAPVSVRISRTLPTRFTVGADLDVEVTLRDAGKNLLDRQPVSLALDRPGGRRLGSTQMETDAHGVARVKLPYAGSAGEVRLIASAGAGADTVTMIAETGEPRLIEVVQDVTPRMVADSLLEQPLVVRLMDVGRNPLPHVPVRLELCWTESLDDAAMRCASDPSSRDRFFRGIHTRETDTVGMARFDSLRVLGPSGRYRFRAVVDGYQGARVESGWMRYDATDVYDRSFVIISAIKSITGAKPANEFFDIRFQFRVNGSLHITLHSELALSRVSSTDSVNVTSPQERLFDASVGVNYTLPWFRVRDPVTDAPERQAFVGAQLRIFSTVPYVVAHLGNVELARSVFRGSSMIGGFAVAPDTTPVLADGVSFRPSRYNILIDAFVRSDGVDFFKFLNIRGTILIPFAVKGQRPVSRIVIAVPIGGLNTF